MSKSLGGQKGIGSLTVHSSRSMAVVSDVLLPTIESTFLNNRADLTETINNLATEYNMDEQLLNRFYHKEYAPTEEQTWKALKAATYVPISTAFKVKQNLDKENTDVTKISNNFQDSVKYNDCDCSPMGSQIDLPNKIILKSDYYLSLIVTMFKNIAAMNALLIENHNKLVSSLKNLVFKKNIKKEHVDSYYKEANLKSDTKFETFWKKITEVFDDWSFVCDTETPVNSHESRVLVVPNEIVPKLVQLVSIRISN